MVFAVSALVAFCYWLGGRRPVRLVVGRRGWGGREWRTAAFAAGLGLAAIILSAPADAWARERFWLRTAQLIVLTMVAAPLIVVGAPWPRLARLIRRSPRGIAVGSRAIAIGAFALFNLALIAAYAPPIYHATAAATLLRQAAQLLMLGLAVFFWSQVIAQPPGRCALNHVERAAYLVLSSMLMRGVGLVLGFASVPFYGTSLFDQQVAAGVLLVPGVLTDLIVLTVCLYLWLGQDERKEAQGFDTGGRPAPVVARPRLLTTVTSRSESLS